MSFLPSAKIGGAEKMMMIILEKLKKNGHEIVIALGSEDGGNKEIVNKTKYVLGNNRARGCVVQSLTAIFIEKPNIIFLNLGYINLAFLIKCIYPKIKIIVRIGNTISSELSKNYFLRFKSILLLRLSVISSDKIIVQSSLMKEDLLRFAGKDAKIEVLPNIVEQDFYKKASEANLIDIKQYIFTAATNKKQKRLDLLLKASAELMKKNKNIHLVVAGTSYKEIQGLLISYSFDTSILDRVHFHGFINNILPLIRDCLFCVSSSDYEGSSNFLIESKSLGKYCVVTDCPGANKETFDGYNKVVYVNPGSVDSLVEGMNIVFNIINTNPEKQFSVFNNKSLLEERHWVENLINIFE